MVALISFYFRYFFLWVVFFIFGTSLFLIYNINNTNELQYGEVIGLFWNGIRMDMSTAGYLTFFPILLSILFLSKKLQKTYDKILTIYTIITAILVFLISTIDVELYRNWGFRIDNTSLSYLKTPTEALASSSFNTIISLLFIFVVQFIVFIFSYKLFVREALSTSIVFRPMHVIIPLFSAASLILPIRGSLGIAPMNVGMVYFSKTSTFANHAAINPIWNFGFSVLEKKEQNKFIFFKEEEAENIFKKITTRRKNIIKEKIIKKGMHNIIIVVLESFTGKIVGKLGGKKEVSPNVDRIASEGILFSNCYASGDRTEKGLVAVLSGYPAQPTSSIMKFSTKTEKLPKLSKKFKEKGYSTNWICGFNTDFANIKSYIYSSNYDKVIDISNFPKEFQGEKWGVHDEYVFNKLFTEISEAQVPHFTTMVTLSSHEPFDVPMPSVFDTSTEDGKFMNSAYYTDKCLGVFYDKLKASPAWDNTILVLIADHGSRLPGNTPLAAPERYKIPMIWAGGALKESGINVQKIISQTDLPTTLLEVFDIDAREFTFSRNAFSDYEYDFAYYSFNNGLGYISERGNYSYDTKAAKEINATADIQEEDKTYAKVWLQILMDDFYEK